MLTLLLALPPVLPQEASAWTHAGGQAGADLGRTLAGGDFDGDGFEDLVVGAPLFDGPRGVDSGEVRVFRGSAAGLAAVPDWSAAGERPRDRFGSAIAVADLDGDGFDDLVIGAPDHDRRDGRAPARASLGHAGPALTSDEGAVYAYLGSPAGLAAAPQRIVRGIEVGERFGFALAPVNANGDAFVDLLVGAPGKLQGLGGVLLFPGTPAGLHGTPVWLRVGGSPNEEYGRILGSIGDRNGDGDEEFIVSVPARNATGTIELFRGSPTGPRAMPDRVLARRLDVLGDTVDIDLDGSLETLYVDGSMARQVLWRDMDGSASGAFRPLKGDIRSVTTGDLNGDGRLDVIAGMPAFVEGPYRGRVSTFMNLPGQPFTPAADFPVFDSEQAGSGWGATLVTLDVDADGADELVVAAPAYDGAHSDEGLVALYPGQRPVLSLERRSVSSGLLFGAAGDFDGDGFDDLVAQLDRERLAVRYGSLAGLPDEPDELVLLPTYPDFDLTETELEAGDFDGDGRTDLLVCTFPADYTHGGRALLADEQVLYRGSAQGLGPSFVQVASGAGRAVTIGDVNGDGREDAMIRREARLDLHLGDATGLSSTVAQFFPNHFWSLVPFDLDGDAYGDVLGHRNDGHCIVFRGSAGGLTVQTGPGGTNSFGNVTLDVDGDGDEDLVWGAQLTTYLSTGSALARSVRWWEGWNSWGAAFHQAFDANGDGWEDLWIEGDRLLLGSPEGLRRIPAWCAPRSGAPRFHARGDFDGDGNVEFLIDVDFTAELLEFAPL